MGKKALKFVGSLAAAILLCMLLKEPQFSDSQSHVLFLLFFAVGLWLTEAIPAFSVGLFIMAYLVFALGNPRFNSHPEEIAKYVNTFSSSVIWLMLGGFFIAAALTKTGLDAKLLAFTLRIAGRRPMRIMFSLMLTTMAASMLMSNTATTAMVVAAVTPLLTKMKKASTTGKAILIGIPLAASVGGMGTIIGTPPNLIAAGALENAGMTIDFLEWMKFGLPLAIALTAVGYLALVKIFVRENDPVAVELPSPDQDAPPDEGMKVKRRIVMIVSIITLALWMTGSLHNLRVAAVAALPIVFLTMTGVLGAPDVRQLPWDTLLLVAGGLALGLSLQETGLLAHYAGMIVTMNLNPLTLFLVFALITMLFSNIMSHTATSTLLIPLGMAIVPEHKTEIALIIGLSSSTAMLLPVSTPPNAIAFSTGLLEQKDLRVIGSIIGLVGPLLVIGWVLLMT